MKTTRYFCDICGAELFPESSWEDKSRKISISTCVESSNLLREATEGYLGEKDPIRDVLTSLIIGDYQDTGIKTTEVCRACVDAISTSVLTTLRERISKRWDITTK